MVRDQGILDMVDYMLIAEIMIINHKAPGMGSVDFIHD